MVEGQRVVVVMPAYNAAQTVQRTLDDLPAGVADDILLVDDGSSDQTPAVARTLGLEVVEHRRNLGYGGNQKTCYAAALARGADIIVMLHPDYQYSPRLAGAMAWMVASGEYDVVLGSRILGKGARKGGMPAYKYYSNRLLTAFQNLMMGVKLSEFHTGYRAYSRRVMETLPLADDSDDFVFDNQVLAQAARFGFRIGEISCPARYFSEASSIDLRRSIVYGLGVVATSLYYRLNAWGIYRHPMFSPAGRTLSPERLADDGVIRA